MFSIIHQLEIIEKQISVLGRSFKVAKGDEAAGIHSGVNTFLLQAAQEFLHKINLHQGFSPGEGQTPI